MMGRDFLCLPDRYYWRVAAGFAAQFKYGISAFAEYQRLQSLRYYEIRTLRWVRGWMDSEFWQRGVRGLARVRPVSSAKTGVSSADIEPSSRDANGSAVDW